MATALDLVTFDRKPCQDLLCRIVTFYVSIPFNLSLAGGGYEDALYTSIWCVADVVIISVQHNG